jgi:hypothetical protein
MDTEKIIQILNPQAQTIKETVIDRTPETRVNLFESRPGARPMTLLEASNLSDFPVLLRDGIRSITFEAYAQTASTWQQWVSVIPSDKPGEDWVEENMIGELPTISEEDPYPEFRLDLDRAFRIANVKRGGIITVTEEMIRFNRLNVLKRHAERLGRSAANTREQACYSVLNTTGNYVRNSTTGDNDIGANTSALTFSATGLNTALNTLRTMKDRKSGVYLGVNPDTLIVAPRLEMAAKQLLLSPTLQIAEGSTTVKVYGTGVTNPFRGLISQIIVSPRLGSSYQWNLQEAKQAVTLQEVEGLQILQATAMDPTNEAYLNNDRLRYRARDWFGVGFVNDRFAFFSSSSSAPTVD